MAADKPRKFRIGALRSGGTDFKPFINVVTTGDGGLIFAPDPVPHSSEWLYVARRQGSRLAVGGGDVKRTHERPKLHWHRSGWTSVSLTGADLAPARRKFKPFPDLRAAQIASIMVERPWAYPSKTLRSADLFLVVEKWPMHLGIEVYAYFVPADRELKIARSSDLPAVGLVDGDGALSVMDMRGHGLQAILVFRVRSAYDDAEAAGISVAAGELRRDASDGSRYVGLWSDHRETLLLTVDDPPPVSAFLGVGRDLGDEPAIAPVDHVGTEVRRIRRDPQRSTGTS